VSKHHDLMSSGDDVIVKHHDVNLTLKKLSINGGSTATLTLYLTLMLLPLTSVSHPQNIGNLLPLGSDKKTAETRMNTVNFGIIKMCSK